jgi:activator of HSP90 ATPase
MLKIVQQSVQLPADAEALYEMYLDRRQHAAITGSSEVRIAAEEGAEFWAFDGRITGRMLALTPGKLIVQTWRSFEWHAEDVDGALILRFSPDPEGGRIDSALVNAPDHLYEKLLANWPMRYWDPWRADLLGPRWT